MLIKDSSLDMVRISRTVIISATAISALFFVFVLGLGIKAQRRKGVTGIEGLIGVKGEAFTELEPIGTVIVKGEIWNAESLAGKMRKGEKIMVRQMKNLKLFVEPIVTE